MKLVLKSVAVAAAIAAFAGTALADRTFPGANCKAQTINGNHFGDSVSPWGYVRLIPTGGSPIACPVSLEETGDVNSVNFEVYASKQGQGNFSCNGYIVFQSGGIIFSPTRYLCSAAGGCSSPADSFVGDSALLLRVPINPADAPSHGGVFCFLGAASRIYTYAHTGGSPGSPLR